MIFEFSPVGAIVAASWFLSVSRGSWVSVSIAFLIFCSKSVPASLLLFLLLQMAAFLQATMGTPRANSGITQKRHGLVLFGVLLSVFGAALGTGSEGGLLVFLGLLLAIPSAPVLFLFGRLHERQTLRSFVGSCLVPGFVALDILLKIRPDLREGNAVIWDLTVMGLGGFTLIHAGMLSFLKTSLKSRLVYGSQAWLGLGLFLSASDSPLAPFAQAGLAILSVAMVALWSAAHHLGARHHAFARVACLGAPGLISFTALLFSFQMALGLGVLPLLVVFLGSFIQALAFVIAKPQETPSLQAGIRYRFWITTAVQVLSGVGLYWMGSGGVR